MTDEMKQPEGEMQPAEEKKEGEGQEGGEQTQ